MAWLRLSLADAETENPHSFLSASCFNFKVYFLINLQLT